MENFFYIYVLIHYCFLVAGINVLWWIFGVEKSFYHSLQLALIIEILLQLIHSVT